MMTFKAKIPGFPGYYATETGLIISRKRSAQRVLKPKIHSSGYSVVNLYYEKNKYRTMFVHRCVCLAFHGRQPTPFHTDVAHADGDKFNNQEENLRWATRKENAQDKAKHGTILRGEKHGRAKLSRADVESIRWMSEIGKTPPTYTELGLAFGVTSVMIGKIVRRESWKHID